MSAHTATVAPRRLQPTIHSASTKTDGTDTEKQEGWVRFWMGVGGMGWVGWGWGAGGSVAALPGLAARQHQIAVIQQGRQRVADCGPVLISKGVGAQIDIGPSEGLL